MSVCVLMAGVCRQPRSASNYGTFKTMTAVSATNGDWLAVRRAGHAKFRPPHVFIVIQALPIMWQEEVMYAGSAAAATA